MLDKFLLLVRKRWVATLGVISFVALIINVMIFYPGYMSNDSVGQLGQALGRNELTDLTPPALSLTWRLLINLTGHVTSMLVFQLAMLWVSLCLIAVTVYQFTKSKRMSLLPLAIGWAPFVVNISGVIWKDNQMAFSLLLVIASSFFVSKLEHRLARWSLVIIGCLFVMYACLIRYNAALAIVPVLYYFITASKVVDAKRLRYVFVAAVFGCTFAVSVAIAAVFNVKAVHPAVAVMLDDIVAVAPYHQMHSPALKDILLPIKACADAKGSDINNFWLCGNEKQWNLMQGEKYGEMQKTWLSTVSQRPFNYAFYRIEGFFVFLLPPQGYKFIWQEGIVTNPFGQTVAFARLGGIVRIYSENLAYKYAPYFFEPWFWLCASAALLIYRKRLGEHRSLCVMLGLSSVLYIISYLPTGATVDYRYIYWPVLAMTVAGVFILADYYAARRR
jgi:hypothetical protein